MVRTLLVVFGCMVAFDHFVGHDKGALFIAAMIERLHLLP
jgi:hypothetical protein